MSVEENKALVRRWIDEVVNDGNMDLVDELLAACRREQFRGV